MISRIAPCLLVPLACLLAASLLTPRARANADGAQPRPEHVVVVANTRFEGSEAVARYYMEKRGIPEQNLFLIEAPGEEEVTWGVFLESVFNPLRRQLVETGWIDGVLTGGVDEDGRLAGVFAGHKIDFLVTVYGVPVKTSGTDEILPPKPTTRPPPTAAAVDSELAFLPARKAPPGNFIRNPLYSRELVTNEHHFGIVRVARLDGPTAAHARALVDSALAGERRGLRGRAYIDAGGPHKPGDQWIEASGRAAEALGFDTAYGPPQRGRFGPTDRFDAPALYFGWYTMHVDGPFRTADLRFPPGAIAAHLHSYSAHRLRTAKEFWAGPLVARGVAATLVNAYEPYLTLNHRYDLFMEALARGRSVGQAAYFALPALSWRGFLIGDPLYQPFAVSLEEQLAASLDPDERDAWEPYAIIRQMNRLRIGEKPEEAIELGERFLNGSGPNPLPVAIVLAELLIDAGRPAEAVARLRPLARAERLPAFLHAAGLEAAELLQRHDATDAAYRLYAVVLNGPGLSAVRAREWLPRGIELAELAGATDTARRWRERLERLTAPDEQP